MFTPVRVDSSQRARVGAPAAHHSVSSAVDHRTQPATLCGIGHSPAACQRLQVREETLNIAAAPLASTAIAAGDVMLACPQLPVFFLSRGVTTYVV